MRQLLLFLMVAVMSFVCLQVAHAQGTSRQLEEQTNANAATGSVSGQTGQSENFTIQRDANAFIGGSTTSFFGGQGAGSGAGLLGMRGLGGLGGMGAGGLGGLGNQANTQSSPEPQIRFRITLGFSHPRPSGAKVSADFARRLTRIPQLPSARSVAVTMEDRTAVLAGAVATEHEKKLIEKLAMMEPGVAAVRNELTVMATPELLPSAGATN